MNNDPVRKLKVLVAIPYHSEKKYAIEKAVERAHELDKSHLDVEILMRFDPGEYGGTDNVKKQREFFRNEAIRGGYDYLYFLGVDTIPPRDVLQRLIGHRKDIVGGVYWGRHNAGNGVPEGAVAWIHGKHPEEQTKIFKKMNQLLSIDGMGMDCVLFSRRVFEQISWLSWVQNDDDYPFYDMAKGLGFEVFIDTNIQCKHYFSKQGYSYLSTAYVK